MSNFSNYGENWLCNFICSRAEPLGSTFDIALLSSADDSSFTELSWEGYSRQQIARSLTSWCGTQGADSVTPSSGNSHTTSNNEAINFGVVQSNVEVAAIGLFTNGNYFAYNNLTTPLQFAAGDEVLLEKGTLLCRLGESSGITDWLSNKLIDFIWRNASFSYPATQYVAFFNLPPTNAGGGMEVVGGGYSRVGINSSGWTSPSDGTIVNTNAVVFNTPSSMWGSVTACGVYDSPNGGNLLWWAEVPPKTIVAGGGTPRFDPSKLSIRVM